jgi:hypothetical protein
MKRANKDRSSKSKSRSGAIKKPKVHKYQMRDRKKLEQKRLENNKKFGAVKGTVEYEQEVESKIAKLTGNPLRSVRKRTRYQPERKVRARAQEGKTEEKKVQRRYVRRIAPQVDPMRVKLFSNMETPVVNVVPTMPTEVYAISGHFNPGRKSYKVDDTKKGNLKIVTFEVGKTLIEKIGRLTDAHVGTPCKRGKYCIDVYTTKWQWEDFMKNKGKGGLPNEAFYLPWAYFVQSPSESMWVFEPYMYKNYQPLLRRYLLKTKLKRVGKIDKLNKNIPADTLAKRKENYRKYLETSEEKKAFFSPKELGNSKRPVRVNPTRAELSNEKHAAILNRAKTARTKRAVNKRREERAKKKAGISKSKTEGNLIRLPKHSNEIKLREKMSTYGKLKAKTRANANSKPKQPSITPSLDETLDSCFFDEKGCLTNECLKVFAAHYNRNKRAYPKRYLLEIITHLDPLNPEDFWLRKTKGQIVSAIMTMKCPNSKPTQRITAKQIRAANNARTAALHKKWRETAKTKREKGPTKMDKRIKDKVDMAIAEEKLATKIKTLAAQSSAKRAIAKKKRQDNRRLKREQQKSQIKVRTAMREMGLKNVSPTPQSTPPSVKVPSRFVRSDPF